ncbi:MAG: adenylosuccinate lyase, partial [uncultured bacterium]
LSEAALMKYRVQVEVLYLVALANESKIKEVRKLSIPELKLLHSLYQDFTEREAEKVKQIEAKTKHDVKAVEYYIKHKLERTSLRKVMEFIHFGLTSEDVNNLAYSLMLRDAIQHVYLPLVKDLIDQLKQRARRYHGLAMLSLTHGQSATPTTLGKEFMVFVLRLQRQYQSLKAIRLLGKFGGATGNWAAVHVAYPTVQWLRFSQRFVEQFDLEFNPVTTQIESHDRLVELFQTISRINTIMQDFNQDMWLYISRGLFVQRNIAGEVGSSAMPHKINPIWFENSEGNSGLANALLNHFSEKLPVSRLQRDLTDSTVLRNQGVALAHSVLSLRNTSKALQRVEPNKDAIAEELDTHWEVLAEAIQTVMRKLGKPTPYEQLKRLTRGQQLDKTTLHIFIDTLDLPEGEKQTLKRLTPATYIGLSKQVAEL